MYVDDKLTELLTELLAKIYVLYPFVKEGECEWYTCVMCCIHLWMKESMHGTHVCVVSIPGGRRVWIVHMFYVFIHVYVCYVYIYSCEKRVWMVYMCYFYIHSCGRGARMVILVLCLYSFMWKEMSNGIHVLEMVYICVICLNVCVAHSDY